ncbi:MAG: hypothetical protein EBY21_00190 [Alphaproteobacteria bacterium]|nr:hypothetical protein [Alphaproteobacteria bacterium]
MAKAATFRCCCRACRSKTSRCAGWDFSKQSQKCLASSTTSTGTPPLIGKASRAASEINS